MNIIKAPFTEAQVARLIKWQKAGYVHPYTCGTQNKHKPDDDKVLIPTVNGFKCPTCDYEQDWAHQCAANEDLPAWRDFAVK